MIESNFMLYVGYLKLCTQRKLADESLKEAGMNDKEIREFIEKRLEDIKALVEKDQF